MITMKLQKISTPLILAGLILPAFAGAVQLETPTQVTLDVNFMLNILSNAVSWLFTIFMVFAVIMLIVAAFKYLTSGGDAARVKDATRAVIYAVVAIAVALLAASARFLVESLLGIGNGGFGGGGVG